MAEIVKKVGRVQIGSSILLVNGRKNDDGIYGYPYQRDEYAEYESDDHCYSPFSKRPQNPWKRIVGIGCEICRYQHSTYLQTDIWTNTLDPMNAVMLACLFRHLAKSKEFQNTNCLVLYQENKPNQDVCLSAEWLSHIAQLKVLSSTVTFVGFKFQSSELCQALTMFTNPEISLRQCSFYKHGKTIAEYLASKRSLYVYESFLNLSEFGKYLSKSTTIQSLTLDREKTKLIAILPGIRENNSLIEINIEGTATPQEWMSLLQCMLQHKTMQKVSISTYSFRRRDDEEFIPANEKAKCDLKLQELVRSNPNIVKLHAYDFIDQHSTSIVWDELFRANKHHQLLLNVEQSVKAAALCQDRALLRKILRHRKVRSDPECVWIIAKTVNEFIAQIWYSHTSKRYEESETMLKELEANIQKLKRQREICLEGRALMKRRLEE